MPVGDKLFRVSLRYHWQGHHLITKSAKLKNLLTSHFPSRYDQTLFEDENKNRMMETKELFEWVLKQQCFEVSFSSL